MELSKELVLQAVTAAFEFNAENNQAKATASYSDNTLTLGVNCFEKDGWAYYKVSTANHTNDPIYANSHEENLAGFLNALKSLTSND
jgi:hypothetical protein